MNLNSQNILNILNLTQGKRLKNLIRIIICDQI